MLSVKPVFSLFFKPFKVLATETLSQKALDADIHSAVPTEKVDGTCCYVTAYKGKMGLLQMFVILITLQTPYVYVSEVGHLLVINPGKPECNSKLKS